MLNQNYRPRDGCWVDRRGLLAPDWSLVRRRLVFGCDCGILTFARGAGDQGSRRLRGRELVDQALCAFDPGRHPQLAADVRDHVFQDIGQPTANAKFGA